MNALKLAKSLPHHTRYRCWCIPCRTLANVPGWLARRSWMSKERRISILGGRPINVASILRYRLIGMRAERVRSALAGR